MNKNQQKYKKGWENVADWYNSITGSEGHYYQKELILPKVLEKLKGIVANKVLDLACGQGVLQRYLPSSVEYCGVDISPKLIRQAQQGVNNKSHSFVVADAASPDLSLIKKDYDVVTIILATQDIEDVGTLFINASKHLKDFGSLIVVMNHPCYRIPRQSSWNIDDLNKVQSRNIKGYMTSFDIPINVNPSKGKSSEQVIYHHRSLSSYSNFLNKADFSINLIEEWVSNKQSTGSKAKMENRARKEFPLFLCLVCQKTRQSVSFQSPEQ